MNKKFLAILILAAIFCMAFGTNDHPKIMDVAFPIFKQLKGELFVTTGFTGSLGIDALESGNMHTDFCNEYNVVDYCGDLDWLYGKCPCGGEYEVLHATRNWKGKDDLTRIDSAHETCTQLRQRIIDASIRALEHYRKGNRDTALYFTNHTTHLIEDSFSPGHTLRDSNTMQLLDHCTASQDHPVLYKRGSTLQNVCQHHQTVNNDQLSEDVNGATRFTPLGRAATQADIGYLIAMKDLFSYAGNNSHSVDQLKAEAARRLTVYFDTPASEGFSLPPLMQTRELSKAQQHRVSGYFSCDLLSTDVPAYIQSEWHSRPDSDWTHFVGYSLNGKPGYLAYKQGSGTYALDWLRLNSSGQMSPKESGRGRIEKGWDFLLSFPSGQGSYLVAYQNNGTLSSYAISTDGKGLSQVQPAGAYGWPGNLAAFFPLTIDKQLYALGYLKESGDLYVAALTPSGIGIPRKFATGDVLRNASRVQGFLFQNQPYLMVYQSATRQTSLVKLNDSALQGVQKGEQLVETGSVTRLDYQWTSILPVYMDQKEVGGMVSKASPSLNFVRVSPDGYLAIDALLQEQNTLTIKTQRRTEPRTVFHMKQWLSFQAGGKAFYLTYYIKSPSDLILEVNSIYP